VFVYLRYFLGNSAYNFKSPFSFPSTPRFRDITTICHSAHPDLRPAGDVFSFELMKLPNPESAIIERGKVADYLLNPAHPDNGGKAAFFLALGFNQDDWEDLALAFRKLAGRAEITKRVASSHGCKYIVEGRIETPGGKSPAVRTVWIIDRGADAPRLVSAYPSQE